MTNHVNYVPEGFHTVTPYMVVKEAAKAIEFYKEAFGAKGSSASKTRRAASATPRS